MGTTPPIAGVVQVPGQMLQGFPFDSMQHDVRRQRQRGDGLPLSAVLTRGLGIRPIWIGRHRWKNGQRLKEQGPLLSKDSLRGKAGEL